MTEEQKWILAWFARRGPVPGTTPEEQLKVDLFKENLIDSLGVVDMILEVETHFGIEFSGDHFQDPRFATIGGLGEIITEIVGSASSSR